ncbi:hypothetical protein B0J13DRAFT_85698 [Dactylonectria estremocensis]|uniref:Zn(2)-C6 fungal-type domain-containing protein n=1 Tax=Dactylonectria estremocensis TaxID=1079267 RepID=A0A9P9ECH2_9HYPO|nr:hypothetical protein B0J13DRAFT_85698 [Dactylonectria estremocensis]
MRRRITCDKAIPHCNKCKVKGLACPGYGVRFRFVPINTVIARGDPRMGSAIHPTHEVTPRTAFDDSQVSNQDTFGNPQDLLTNPLITGTANDCTSLATTHSESPHSGGHWNVFQHRANKRQDGSVDDLTSTPHRSLSKAHSFTSPSCPIPRILDPIDALPRFLLDHFAEQISSIMISFDGKGNGYRDYLLPMAHVDPLIQQALCVTAAFHLAQHMPRLLAYAEKTRAVIIGNLRKRASCVNALDEVTWAVINTLILGDLFTGSEEIKPLYHSLTSYMAARGTTDLKSPLVQFLYIQAQMLSFFAGAFMAEYQGIWTASRRFLNPMESSEPDAGPGIKDSHVLPQNLDVHCVTSEIYLLRVESRVVSTNEVRMAGLIRQLRVQLEHTKHELGSHTLAWPCFLGAMESRSEDDRRFFSTHLLRIWETSGSTNMPKSLDRMPTAWERTALGGWVERFPDKKSF